MFRIHHRTEAETTNPTVTRPPPPEVFDRTLEPITSHNPVLYLPGMIQHVPGHPAHKVPRRPDHSTPQASLR
jgi:hypothetical protein